MIDVLAAIRQRASLRSYSDQPAEPALLERLLALGTTVDRLTDVPPRIALISGVDRTQHILTTIVGSYGLVQNPPHLLVGILPQESALARLDLGYVLEQIVLEATRSGLGTCWITGSYDPQHAGDGVGLAAGEVAAAVCALGYPSQDRRGRFHDRMVRRLAGGHRRKPLADIVFSRYWGQQWMPHDADPELVALLEYARLAPSARNRQPWRFIITPDQVVLTLTHLEPIDGGIVMAHFALAAIACGYDFGGRWQIHLGDTDLAQSCRLPSGVIPVATFSRS
jgi:nitroreductase